MKKLLASKEENRRLMVLQLLSEGGEGDNPSPDGGKPTGDSKPADDGKPTDGGNKKPFATFPDEKSFMARIKREAQNMQSEFLKSLGIENEDELKAILEAEKKRKEDQMTEAEKLQKQLAELETERNQALERAEQTARNTEAKILALELGVNPARINHFLKLADLSDVKVYKDGSVDTETMKGKLSELLKELPEFKGATAPAPQGGGDFGGSNNQKPSLTIEQIKSMSKEEIAENIEEVRKILGQSK